MLTTAPAATKPAKKQSLLVDDLVLDHGPVPLLGRFVLGVADRAQEHGITLEFATAGELAEANKQNSQSWLKLIPMYDPACSKLDAANFIGVIGRDRTGEVVTANAIRLYDWRGTNLDAEASSLRFMYEDPDQCRPGEVCRLTADVPVNAVTGLSAFSGAAWVRPTHRGLGLTECLPLLIKALGLSAWNPDVIFGIMAQTVHQRGFSRRFGFSHEAWELQWANSPHGTQSAAVLWADQNFVISDVTAFTSRHSTKIQGGLVQRNA
jgi:hypothetical protein